MTIKRYGLITVLLLSPLLPLQSSFGDSVNILTPSQIPVPQLVARNHDTTIVIESTDPSVVRYSGFEIAVASPTGGLSSLTGFCPITYTPGPNWQLRADVDGDGDFIGGTDSPVGYDLFALGDKVTGEFGDGGFVNIDLFGSATITPFIPNPIDPTDPHPARYAWQEVDGSGTPFGPFGTDNTLLLGIYSAGSCGFENGEPPTSEFFGTDQFIVIEGCAQSAEQPQDPISMNTVKSGDIVKTIHAEKHIFECTLEQGLIPVIADVTIIAEIYEDMSTKSVIKKQALAITCIKQERNAQVLDCDSQVPSQDATVVRNCTEEPIAHPQEMDTVRKGNIVKTIEAQKELFECVIDLEPVTVKKVGIVLFTEVWENLNNLDDPIIKVTFESVRCVISLIDTLPDVESCTFPKVFN